MAAVVVSAWQGAQDSEEAFQWRPGGQSQGQILWEMALVLEQRLSWPGVMYLHSPLDMYGAWGYFLLAKPVQAPAPFPAASSTATRTFSSLFASCSLVALQEAFPEVQKAKQDHPTGATPHAVCGLTPVTLQAAEEVDPVTAVVFVASGHRAQGGPPVAFP